MSHINHNDISRRCIGLGCMGLSWAYEDRTLQRSQKIKFLREAVDLGVSFFDTSDQYGPFANETLIGDALSPYRDQVRIATKGGLVVTEKGETRRNGSPKHLVDAFHSSLIRLRTSYIDLYQLHRVDPDVSLEHSWEALAGLAADGQALSLGLSEVGVDEIERAARIHPVSSVQSELSLWSRGALDEVVPYCKENGIEFIAFSPLGRGYLTGAVVSPDDLATHDWRRNHPRFQKSSMDSNAGIVETIRACAESLGYTAAQVALAWVLAQGDHITIIPGSQRKAHLEENLLAEEVDLGDQWSGVLDALPPASGARN